MRPSLIDNESWGVSQYSPVRTCAAMAQLLRMYLTAVVLLIILFSLMVVWEALVMTRSCSSCDASVLRVSPLGEQGDVDPSRGALANFTQRLLQLQNRPLLVRFDWYSRKKTPVHIGYCNTRSTAIPDKY